MIESDNKRIAKNTVLLYCRMLVVMGIGFFTSRELLDVLGEVDYGLTNVIASVVTMFSFLSGMMTSAAARYFTFEIGRKNFEGLRKVFNLTQLIYCGLFIIILILSETVGLWFFNNRIIVPETRLNAAFWFFQFSIATFLINMVAIPYNSLIIAHENMKVFSLISSFDAIAKLCIIYTLSLSKFDYLAYYGAMLTLVAAISLSSYALICRKLYSESHYKFYWDKELFKELLSFSGWNLFGAMSGLFTNVFINVLLNNYFGPVVNAARGIAVQVSSAVSAFMQNFLTAARPQIIKFWSSGNKQAMHLLVNRSSKFGFFLMLFLSLPVLFEAEVLLGIWLKKVPDYTIIFTRLVIVGVLLDTISYPLMVAAQATGKIALYQTVVGLTLWLNLPISWFLFKNGYPPDSFAWVAILVGCVCLVLRLVLLRRSCHLPIRLFFKSVILPSILVTGLAIITPFYVYLKMEPGLYRMLIQCFVCFLSSGLAIIIAGLSANERTKIFEMFKKYFFFNLYSPRQ